MKIERLNKDNINDFIVNMNISDGDEIINDINKKEYYGVRDDNYFLVGFVIEPEEDVISIKYDNTKVNGEKYLEIINYLKDNMVVRNHLVIEVSNAKRMNILDENFRCKEVHMVVRNNEEVGSNSFREKYAEIDMMSIRYNEAKDDIVCNLVRQNIQDEELIFKLHEFFLSIDTKNIRFIANIEVMDYLTSIGYKCECKHYVL